MYVSCTRRLISKKIFFCSLRRLQYSGPQPKRDIVALVIFFCMSVNTNSNMGWYLFSKDKSKWREMTKSKLSATNIIPPPVTAIATAVAPSLPSFCRRRCLLFAAAAAFLTPPPLQPLRRRCCLLIAAPSLAVFAVVLLPPRSCLMRYVNICIMSGFCSFLSFPSAHLT